MFRHLWIAGLVLSSLTIVTVGLAQQSGSQGRVALPAQSPALAAVALSDAGKARLSRMVEPRRALADCGAKACDTPPKTDHAAVQAETAAQVGCGDQAPAARDRNGKPIRRICQFF